MLLPSLRTLLLLVPFAVVACSSGENENATQGDDQNVKAGKLGEAGMMCGGIAGIRCKAGLDCKLGGTFPDAAGTCAAKGAKPGEAGGACGGIAGISCKPGLRCDLFGKAFDATGVCGIDDHSEPPIVTCQAIPSCNADEEPIASCALKDKTCRTITMCGHSVSCRSKAAEVTVEGTLKHTVGIGGENTGQSISTADGITELVLDEKESASFVSGRFAKVTGKKTTLSGIETHDRPAIDVSDILVCPDKGSTVNCMPIVDPKNARFCGADRSWVQKNCGVSFVD